MHTLRTRIAFAALIIATAATPTLAQSSPKPAAASAKAATSFAGEWEGSYHTDHGPGGPLSMHISKDSVWRATADVIVDSQTIPTRITNVSVDGNTIAWTQEIMGMSCKASAVLEGQELKGTTECEHGTMTMLMRKK